MADCNYRIKNMYDGVLGYFNKDLTDKKAKELINKHKAGLELFSEYPGKEESELTAGPAKEPTKTDAEIEAIAGEERKKKAMERIAGLSSTQLADAKKLYSIDKDLKGKALIEEIYNHESKL